jgi:hypothetical protein
MMTAAEALIELERRMFEAGARVAHYRFLPYPCSDQRSIMVCAELPGGDEIQIAFRLDHPLPTDDSYDEDAVAAEFFAMPSLQVH